MTLGKKCDYVPSLRSCELPTKLAVPEDTLRSDQAIYPKAIAWNLAKGYPPRRFRRLVELVPPFYFGDPRGREGTSPAVVSSWAQRIKPTMINTSPTTRNVEIVS